MKYIVKAFSFVILSLVIVSCEKEEPAVVVDTRLQPYFDRFVDEASQRGVVVDFNQIQVEGMITDIEGDNINGQCQSNSARPNVLLIDLAFWNGANDLAKEFVIFHELGHCYLDRSHLDTQNSDGTCFSMMHSGTSGCTNAYSTMSRSSYLDELFNP